MENRHSLLLLVLPLLFLTLALPTMQQKLSSVDLRALASIKNSLTDVPLRRTRSSFFSTWDFAAPDPCSTFAGITCSSFGRVTTLTLGTGLADSPGLAGSIPPSVADLTELTQLILYPGIVTGPIPRQLGLRLVNLRVLSLTNNRLTGPIPATLSLLVNLHTLDLSSNRLSGWVPQGLTRLPLLKVLILSSNEISGDIPAFDSSSQLLHLDLKSNKLTGTLPQPLPTTLRYVSLSDNSLVGQLDGLESLTELVHLDLSMNRLSGAPPASLFRTTLSSLMLQRNNLSGWVPNVTTELEWGPGSVVDLSHNALSGELSTALAGVESLYLNNNRLIGHVPREYVKSVYVGTTRTLYLQHNYLSGFPVEPGTALPDTVSLCLSYNCMVPPVGLAACPASAGTALSRPAAQCSVFNYG